MVVVELLPGEAKEFVERPEDERPSVARPAVVALPASVALPAVEAWAASVALPEVALPEEWAHQFACWAAQRLGRVYPG
jgi:hypothetical protein